MFLRENKLKISVAIIYLVVLFSMIIGGYVKSREEDKKLSAMLSDLKSNKKNAASDTKVKDGPSGEKTPEVNVEVLKYKGSSELVSINNLRWKNKKWVALGDNITAGKGYQDMVIESCGMANVVSDASIGRLMRDMTLNMTSDKLKAVDIITVFGGTSDYSLNTPLGTKADDEMTNSFYGSLHKTIKKLITLKPEATIVFFTPVKRAAYKTYPVYPKPNNAGVTLEQYVQAIKEVCKNYNILVYDLFDESGIDEKNIKKYTTDNLNLNDVGYKKISKLIADYLKTIK